MGQISDLQLTSFWQILVGGSSCCCCYRGKTKSTPRLGLGLEFDNKLHFILLKMTSLVDLWRKFLQLFRYFRDPGLRGSSVFAYENIYIIGKEEHVIFWPKQASKIKMTIFWHQLGEILITRVERESLNLHSTSYMKSSTNQKKIECELVSSIRDQVSENNSLVNDAKQLPTYS